MIVSEENFDNFCFVFFFVFDPRVVENRLVVTFLLGLCQCGGKQSTLFFPPWEKR